MTTPQDIAGLVARMDLEQFEGHTPGPWTAGDRAWPEQVGCCPLIGRPYSIHGTDYRNVAAATTLANARLIAASPDLLQYASDLKATVERLSSELAGSREMGTLLAARIAELEGALRPFARIADMEISADPSATVGVNIERCRDARAALNQEQRG